MEQHNHVDNEVSIFLQQLNQHVHRKLEDVWLSSTAGAAHSVSSSIDVPKRSGSVFSKDFFDSLMVSVLVLIFSDLLFRSVESADMDEIMAAMVLTSLSCSPMIQSPVHGEPNPG